MSLDGPTTGTNLISECGSSPSSARSSRSKTDIRNSSILTTAEWFSARWETGKDHPAHWLVCECDHLPRHAKLFVLLLDADKKLVFTCKPKRVTTDTFPERRYTIVSDPTYVKAGTNVYPKQKLPFTLHRGVETNMVADFFVDPMMILKNVRKPSP